MNIGGLDPRPGAPYEVPQRAVDTLHHEPCGGPEAVAGRGGFAGEIRQPTDNARGEGRGPHDGEDHEDVAVRGQAMQDAVLGFLGVADHAGSDAVVEKDLCQRETGTNESRRAVR